MVKGRPNTDLAHKFVDMMLSAEEQVNTAKYIFYGPVNRMAKLDPETAKSVVYGARGHDQAHGGELGGHQPEAPGVDRALEQGDRGPVTAPADPGQAWRTSS